MENNNQRALCQQLWARNKYLVLSHSSNVYNEIRQYLKNEEVEVSLVQDMIDRACQIPEHRVRFAMPFSIFGAISKRKQQMLSARTICSCLIATALVRLLRKN